MGCSSLEEYSFSENLADLENISGNSFDGCVKLADENGLVIVNGVLMWVDKEVAAPHLTLSEGISGWTYNALSSAGITSVTVPAYFNREGLEDLLRRGVKTLQKIEVAAENIMYASLEGSLYNKEKTKLLLCSRGKEGSFVIPRGVEEIGFGAISKCPYITEVYVPDSVKAIADGMETDSAMGEEKYAPFYFEGDAPDVPERSPRTGAFHPGPEQKIYYVEGTSGWDALKAEYSDIQWLTWDGKGP